MFKSFLLSLQGLELSACTRACSGARRRSFACQCPHGCLASSDKASGASRIPGLRTDAACCSYSRCILPFPLESFGLANALERFLLTLELTSTGTHSLEVRRIGRDRQKQRDSLIILLSVRQTLGLDNPVTCSDFHIGSAHDWWDCALRHARNHLLYGLIDKCFVERGAWAEREVGLVGLNGDCVDDLPVHSLDGDGAVDLHGAANLVRLFVDAANDVPVRIDGG